MLTCTRCYRTLPKDRFSPNRHRTSGHQSACKDCLAAARQEAYRTNGGRMRAQNRMYRARERAELNWYRTHYPRPTKPWLDNRPDLWEPKTND